MRRATWLGSGPKTAMAAALVAPFVPWWGWPAVALVLLLTWSWLAFLAVAAGLVVRHPAWGPWAAVLGVAVIALWIWSPTVFGRPILQWTPRGDRNSTIWGRWYGVQLACCRATFWGRGPGSMRRDLRRWHSRGVRGLPTDSLLCEPVQLCYEYGVPGSVALGALLGLIATSVTWGSAWSAAWVTLGVLSLGHAPVRYAGGWAARTFRRLIPTPPLLADYTLHVCADGTFRMYSDLGQYEKGYTAEQWAMIAAAVLRAGKHIADEHGLTIEDIGLEP